MPGQTDLVPWTTFTDPEVAQVGLTEERARAQQGNDVRTCEWPMSRVDRARTDGHTEGLIKLVHRRNGTLLGATIVAPRAGEMIHEWLVALQQGIKVADLSKAIHVYPSYSVAGMQAAAEIRINQFLNGRSGKMVRSLARLTR
jgi:pyruvate/2-oxoglutarate dehydrogenase complex dihydrolipoamide dehydrogenase (E3) component